MAQSTESGYAMIWQLLRQGLIIRVLTAPSRHTHIGKSECDQEQRNGKQYVIAAKHK